MSARSEEYLEAIDHLPAGAVITFSNVTWDEYENILEKLTDRPGVRVSYDGGILEVMSVSHEHEEYKDTIFRLVVVVSEELQIPLETRGAATWKRRKFGKGAEPDTCFYVANAGRMIGKRKVDLESDPAPDIVVEIELTSSSLNKFPIYGAVGVPEIWRYDGAKVYFYELAVEAYREISESRFLRGLTPGIVEQVLEESKTAGQTEALRAFRQRIRARS